MNNYATPSYVPEYFFREGDSTYLFKIGTYEFHVYSLMIMLGYLASILTIIYFWNREKMPWSKLYALVVITIPMGIIGSRIGYIIEELIYSETPFANSAWYAIWEGGLSIQGGVAITIFCDVIYAYTQRKELDIRKGISYIIPTILVGQFIGRFGNYANHEVYGKIDWTGASVLPFGKTFADNMYISDAYTDSLGLKAAYRYPLFLYEGLLNLFGYLVIVWVFNLLGTFKPGSTAGLYLLWYGLVRIALEPYRQESYGLYSYVALIFVLLGALIFVYFQFWSKTKYIVTKKHKIFKFYTYQDEATYIKRVNATSIPFLFKKTYMKLWLK
ncbi:prolipoprotein diacylglyceryl transferase [Mycoplasma leonicaptivi]|uniref:prolipoprotein diacylglyceryl transferase n=1 Tax=Mycoplasma leonicaptivi TaxID=36742 RepID=UPI00047FCFF8|nr:prolipoprotein diacylglyceryl transferase [Mycoplasma leonicaptivi]